MIGGHPVRSRAYDQLPMADSRCPGAATVIIDMISAHTHNADTT